MSEPERAVTLALGRCRTRYAPDDRVAVFELDAETRGTEVFVSGTVSTDELRSRAVEAADRATDAPLRTDVSVLESNVERRVVSVSKVACRAHPDEASERVTEVIYGMAVGAFDERDGWRRVRVPDGYVAWLPEDVLVTPFEYETDAVITATDVDAAGVGSLYAGTPVERLSRESGDGDVRVRFRTGETASLPPTTVGQPHEDPDGEDVLAATRTYLETDYLWGGMTVDGIDCSGLVWMSYWRTGIRLPRDADLQRQMGRPVARDELRAGDLLFFPGHVAVSAGGLAFVHASGSANRVVEASLDPAADAYDADRDGDFDRARRLL